MLKSIIVAVQNLDRFVGIIRVLAAADDRLRLADIAHKTGLNKATTQELLAALRAKGFVDSRDEDKTFSLHPQLVLLCLVAARNSQLGRIARPALEHLPEVTDDITCPTVRDGGYSVCVERVLGNYPIQTLSINGSSRRPLGVGTGPVAALGALPLQEAICSAVTRQRLKAQVV